MKRKAILSLILALTLLGGVCAGFAAAGSSSDPFISLSFLRGDYAEAVLEEASSSINASLTAEFEAASAGLHGGDTGDFKRVSMLTGGEIRLNFGGSAILLSGAAALNVEKGEVINVTEGLTAGSGAMKTMNRYLAAESSSALLRFSASSEVLLDADATVLSGQGEGSPFTDIFQKDWFYADVVSAVKMGLINGMTSSTFVPNGTITNAQVIKLAACAHQRYNEGSVTLQNGSPWYRSYADYALSNGIISAEPENYDEACTRAYYIAVMYRAMPEREYAAINTIPDGAVPDVQPGDEYYDEIYGFYRAGIVTGNDSKGTFAPRSYVKRSEVATLAARMFDASVRKPVSIG